MLLDMGSGLDLLVRVRRSRRMVCLSLCNEAGLEP